MNYEIKKTVWKNNNNNKITTNCVHWVLRVNSANPLYWLKDLRTFSATISTAGVSALKKKKKILSFLVSKCGWGELKIVFKKNYYKVIKKLLHFIKFFFTKNTPGQSKTLK